MNAHPDSLPPALAVSRRAMVRSAVALSALALAGASQSAEAGRGWCRTDPVILIDGELADIFCTAPLSILLKVTGPTEFVISVPEGVKTHLLLAGIGFGRGEKVRFKQSDKLEKKNGRIDVKVDVFVPAKSDLPIGVEFAPRILGILNPDTADGFANDWITLRTTF